MLTLLAIRVGILYTGLQIGSTYCRITTSSKTRQELTEEKEWSNQMSNNMNLSGKVILITGGAQGIGGATAQLCGAETCLIIADLKEKGEEHAAAIRQSGGDAVFHQLDVRSASEVSALFESVQASPGRLDVAIWRRAFCRGSFSSPKSWTSKSLSG